MSRVRGCGALTVAALVAACSHATRGPASPAASGAAGDVPAAAASAPAAATREAVAAP